MYLCRVRCRWEKEICNPGERKEDDGGRGGGACRVTVLFLYIDVRAVYHKTEGVVDTVLCTNDLK
jgi:hypothetical protein